DRQVGMTRGWTLMHVIDGNSPLHELDSHTLKQLELELYIALTGIDETTMQTVHAIHKYNDDEIKVDHHFADTLLALESGEYAVDMPQFDVVVPDAAARDSVPG